MKLENWFLQNYCKNSHFYSSYQNEKLKIEQKINFSFFNFSCKYRKYTKLNIEVFFDFLIVFEQLVSSVQ